MKTTTLTVLFSIGIISCIYAQSITVASFNMKYSIEENHEKDSVNGQDWQRRGPVVASMIRFHEFEIVGTQECLLHQLTDLSEWLPEYSYVGIGREDGEQAGEFSAILYNTNRFKVLEKGDFWLSETPEKPSLGWDATCCNRICSWAYFQDVETDKRFYFFNVHFDHQGVVARKESSKLILSKIKDIAGNNPVVLTGDFNGSRDSEWYKTLANSEQLTDSYDEAKDPYANNGSFNGFRPFPSSNSVIDHVFVTKQFSTLKWGILTDTYHGKFPSDHFPVMVKLKFE